MSMKINIFRKARELAKNFPETYKLNAEVREDELFWVLSKNYNGEFRAIVESHTGLHKELLTLQQYIDWAKYDAITC